LSAQPKGKEILRTQEQPIITQLKRKKENKRKWGKQKLQRGQKQKSQ
jgi:hypothetical protein